MQAETWSIDSLAESASRWASTRMTRRSFLGRFGRTALLVASGPSIAVLLADEAEARVCGQTGVSVGCPTFDCNDVWGWCWYATGCCADGLLKKICDCCAYQYPNVHGYCPAGHNVKCIVESCGTDPRVQSVHISRVATDDPRAAAWYARDNRFPHRQTHAVIGDQEGLFPAVATAFGGVIGAPVFLVPRSELDPGIVWEIRHTWGGHARILGPNLPASIDAQLVANGITPERIGSALDVETFSGEVAAWVANNLHPRNTVCIANHGLSAAAAPVAAAFASTLSLPLTVGPDTPRAGGGMYLVGPEAAHRAGSFPGAALVDGPDLRTIAAGLAYHAKAAGYVRDTLLLAPSDYPGMWGLAGRGFPIVIHDRGSLGGVLPHLLGLRDDVRHVILAGVEAAIDPPSLRHLQSLVNRFEIHKLVGVGGQGLPVYSQPAAERVIGRARLGTDPPPARGRPRRPVRRRRVVRRRRRIVRRRR